ncbi:hypothetical protein BC828DRAFT_37404 [Blastocladiella britannica]|nr:hypothetical protein BC828DRAFT_37404 [Blastocladiella britannica]
MQIALPSGMHISSARASPIPRLRQRSPRFSASLGRSLTGRHLEICSAIWVTPNRSISFFIPPIQSSQQTSKKLQLHLLLSACLSRAIDTQERDPGRFVHDIRSTRRCINRKWDALTAHILQNSETYPRESTENLQIVQEFPPNYRFCVWGNYTRNPRHKTFDISGGLHVTLPKSLTLANVAIRVIHDRSFASLTDFALQHAAGTRTPATQHQRHTVLDGVLHFSLLELPELPKTVDFWTIRQLMASDLSVREVSYPFPRGEEEGGGDGEEGNGGDGEGPPKSADGSGGSGGATSSQGGGGGDSSLNSSMAGKDDDAMLISYTIGAGLFLNPVATVKWWSSETQTWRSEGVSDVEIDRTKGSVMFKSSMFRPCALVQPGYLEFPPENWRIFPLPVSRVDLALGNAVRMVVNGKWTDLEIEITRAGVSLIRPMTDRLRLSMGSLSLAPSRFFDTLARFGIAFSSPHDLSTAPKLSAIDTYDDECYCAMAAKSERLGFSAHKLNSGETIRLINVSLNPTVPDAAAPTPASDVPPGIAPMPKASAVASAAEEDGMMPPSAGGNAFSAEAAPPKSAGSGTLGPGAVDPALDGSDKAASAPKTADAALTVVADYDHVVLAKSRKLFYVAAPGNYGQWPEDQQDPCMHFWISLRLAKTQTSTCSALSPKYFGSSTS